MSLLATLTTVALLTAAVVALLPDTGGGRTPGSRAVWPVAVAAASAALAVALPGAVDPAGVALTLLVVALTGIVQAFASRHLRGDPRARSFFALSSVAAAGTTASATAGDTVVLAGGWTVATLSMLALIATGGAGAQTRAAVRRSAVALLIGDAALWAGVAVAAAATGSTSLRALGGMDATAAGVVAVLVAVAAIARAGSFPLHGWLPATAATTTPVSALLHAGFVNAGVLLLLRFSTAPSTAGAWIVGVAGTITMIAATTAALTRPDVKGRLVHSTAAQMGFMLMACASGAFGLALVHAIGHAMFKASLFLGAGSAVEHALRARGLGAGDRSRRGAVVGGALLLVTGVTVALSTGAVTHPTAALLLFPLATAVVAAVRIGSGPGRVTARAVLLLALSAVLAGYVGLVFPAAEALVPGPGASALSVVLPVTALLGAAIVALLIRRAGPLGDRVFAIAFAWGRPAIPSPTASPSASVGGPLEYRRA